MAVVLDIYHQKMLIVNIYLPPPIQMQVLYDLMVTLAPFISLPTLFMGDFNATLDPKLDSSNTNRPASTDLYSWLSVTGLAELWRWKHPNVKSYSYLSATHRSSARTDLAFGNPPLLMYFYEAEYLAGGTSVHCPLSVTLTLPVGGRRGGWRLSPDWLLEDQVASQIQGSTAAYWSTNVDKAEPTLVWDAFKAVVRGGMCLCDKSGQERSQCTGGASPS